MPDMPGIIGPRPTTPVDRSSSGTPAGGATSGQSQQMQTPHGLAARGGPPRSSSAPPLRAPIPRRPSSVDTANVQRLEEQASTVSPTLLGSPTTPRPASPETPKPDVTFAPTPFTPPSPPSTPSSDGSSTPSIHTPRPSTPGLPTPPSTPGLDRSSSPPVHNRAPGDHGLPTPPSTPPLGGQHPQTPMLDPSIPQNTDALIAHMQQTNLNNQNVQLAMNDLQNRQMLFNTAMTAEASQRKIVQDLAEAQAKTATAGATAVKNLA